MKKQKMETADKILITAIVLALLFIVSQAIRWATPGYVSICPKNMDVTTSFKNFKGQSTVTIDCKEKSE